MRPSLEMLRRIGPRGRTLASALLIAASLPPWDLGFLAWVALIPWLSGLSRLPNRRQAFLQGLWLSFALGLLAAHWVAYAAHEFLQLGWPASALALLLFAPWAQPHLALFAPLVRWAGERTPRAPGAGASLVLCIGLAFCYAGLEWAVPRPLDVGLGYALHGAAHLRQLAELGGVALLTFVVVLVNATLWRLWELQRAGEGGPRLLAAHVGLVLLVYTSASLHGLARSREIAAAIERSDRSLRVGIVQGNVENAVRLAWARGDERAAERQLGTYMLLTETLRQEQPEPDLVIWPEATFPGVFRQPGSTLQRGRANKFDRQMLKLQRPVVFGAYDMETAGEARILYNALFAITPSYDRPGSLGQVQRYRKHELLPIAETLPGASHGGWLKRLLPSLGFFGRGLGARLFSIETPDREVVRLAPIICSEALFTSHVADGARRGGQLILNVGSDGWFGPYGEPQFHLAISRLRSVETRRTQIRVANTGISALILPDGEISRRSALGAEAAMIFEVPIVSSRDTLIVRWGDWFGRAALAAGVGLLLVLHLTGFRRGRPREDG